MRRSQVRPGRHHLDEADHHSEDRDLSRDDGVEFPVLDVPILELVADEHPDVPVYTAAIDDHLNDNKYIVPGLGDAGDRLFGTSH